jgi:preprotein translocase subunit SecA
VMMDGIKEESVGYLFNLEVQIDDEPEVGEGADAQAVFEGVAAGGPQAAPAGAAADQEQHPHITAKGLQRSSQPQRLTYSAPTVDGDQGDEGDGTQHTTTTVAEENEYAGTPRNALCPCGSGRKYKRCHGDPTNR